MFFGSNSVLCGLPGIIYDLYPSRCYDSRGIKDSILNTPVWINQLLERYRLVSYTVQREAGLRGVRDKHLGGGER